MSTRSPELNPDQAADVFDANGKLLFPGLEDTHVHLTHTRQAVGFQMLARAGVICALDCGGFANEVIEGKQMIFVAPEIRTVLEEIEEEV